MTHQKAMFHALRVIKERLEEINECAFSAHEEGDNRIRDEALILQRGFVECADIVDKMLALADELSARRKIPENSRYAPLSSLHLTMQTTHTPAPWRVTKHDSGLLKVETKDRVICDAFAGEQANANLIAAAPELLSSLQFLLIEVDAVLADAIGAKAKMVIRANEARAIIVKATTA